MCTDYYVNCEPIPKIQFLFERVCFQVGPVFIENSSKMIGTFVLLVFLCIGLYKPILLSFKLIIASPAELSSLRLSIA